MPQCVAPIKSGKHHMCQLLYLVVHRAGVEIVCMLDIIIHPLAGATHRLLPEAADGIKSLVCKLVLIGSLAHNVLPP